jgi:hypothetical protein
MSQTLSMVTDNILNDLSQIETKILFTGLLQRYDVLIDPLIYNHKFYFSSVAIQESMKTFAL